MLLKIRRSRSVLTYVLFSSFFALVGKNSPMIDVFPAAQKSFDVQQKEFVIVIPSYNNKQWYKENLESALCQAYTNFEIIFVDDCSSDHTGDLVYEYLKDKKLPCKVTLIRNNERRLALTNLYTSIHAVDSHKIIVALDGDDQLAHNQVLSFLNDIYKNPEVWLTYGQFKCWPSGTVGFSCTQISPTTIQKNDYRSHPEVPSHLRTFYAWLFQQIRLEDLMYHGEFFPMTWDQGMMFPMLELSGGRFRYIPQITYLYNETNPINDHKVNNALQKGLALLIRSMRKYSALPAPKMNDAATWAGSKADIVVLHQSGDSARLEATLSSLEKYADSVGQVTVVGDLPGECLKKQYHNVQIIDSSKGLHRSMLVALLAKAKSEYIVIISDSVVVTQAISMSNLIGALEKTHAHFFDLSLDTALLKNALQIDDVLYTWQSNGDENIGNFTQALLARKQDLIALFTSQAIAKLADVLDRCRKVMCLEHSLNICFEHAKVIELK